MVEKLFENNGECLKASLLAMGNVHRIKNVLRRAEAGEPITLGFLGGSITQGGGAGSGRNFVQCVTDHFRAEFPKSEIKSVNAGIGATGSRIAVFRMEKDVLFSKPDILFIDHSVNDVGDEQREPGGTLETYECIIRRGLLAGAAIVPVCFCNCTGGSCRDIDLKIAEYYSLPFVSVEDGVSKCLIAKGKAEWSDYSGDNVHPNATGHEMTGELIWHYVKCVMEAEDEDEAEFPEPLYSDVFMNTETFDNTTLTPDSLGSFVVGDIDFNQFKNGWKTEAGSGSEPMVINVDACRRIMLLFVKDPGELAGRAEVDVNGQKCVINTLFPNGWGKYAETKTVFSSEVPEKATIRISSLDPDKRFALLKVMVAK